MKYYLIAGEASGDLHASRLMQELKKRDPDAEFRFFGGDMMQAVGGTMVKHYREMAYMGFVPVLLHLPTILKNMKRAKHDIMEWMPDALILVDYPGFNLNMAKYVHKHRGERAETKSQKTESNGQRTGDDGQRTTTLPQIYYYIAPKIWAWKEYRIKNIKRDIDKLFSILPFEVEFFEGKHHYPIHYVGNPTAEEVRISINSSPSPKHCLGKAGETTAAGETAGTEGTGGATEMPIIALLCGSRKQEIKDNLPAMLTVTDRLAQQYQVVIAGAPGIEADYYQQFTEGHHADIVFGKTYELLRQAHAALVTSGTATLETALFGVPQVVCYETPIPKIAGWIRKKMLKVKYISLVNLIADREVVRELVADTFTVENIENELRAILPENSTARKAMLEGYKEVQQRLGNENAPENAARIMVELLRKSGTNQ